MSVWIALLRAVNVGGHGKIAMADLRRICEDAGCRNVRTYIASGNVVFSRDGAESDIRVRLEHALESFVGTPVDVIVRSAGDLEAAFDACPFHAHAPNQVAIGFLKGQVPEGALADIRGRNGEDIHIAAREIHVHYPDGMGRSRLRLPALERGTARNLNTVWKLIQMAREVTS